MKMNIKHLVSTLLILSFGLLAVLVPGGPIETRSFSHIDPLILAGFNTFLTTLVIVSPMLVYFIVKNKPWAWVISALCGVSYFLVYALDLGKIFPVSPDPMPPTLYIIEVLGAIVSVPLMFFAVRGAILMGDRHETATIPASNSNLDISFHVWRSWESASLFLPPNRQWVIKRSPLAPLRKGGTRKVPLFKLTKGDLGGSKRIAEENSVISKIHFLM